MLVVETRKGERKKERLLHANDTEKGVKAIEVAEGEAKAFLQLSHGLIWIVWNVWASATHMCQVHPTVSTVVLLVLLRYSSSVARAQLDAIKFSSIILIFSR